MELIEKALAKARALQQEREGKNPGSSGVDPTVATRAARAAVNQPAKGAGASDQAASPANFDSIRYVQTRVEGANQAHWIENRLVAANSSDQNADVFRILRSKILLPMRENGWQTLAVVGATPGVGKTTIASNLALSIALDANQSVLLVDADLRKPKVASYFGLKPEYGLGDYLGSDLPLEKILVNPGVERLVVIPSTGSLQNSTELLGGRRMQELLPELRNRYASRIVIFDLPPLLATGDALSFLHNFDCALMVVENGRNTSEELLESKRVLQGTNFLGWVLNKGDSATGGYYYHYGATANATATG